MDQSMIGIAVVGVIVAFVVYQSFFSKSDKVTPTPTKAPAPAKAPAVKAPAVKAPAVKAPAKSTVPSVAELNKKTKAELELLARENGVELDLRKKKADLVKQARSSFEQK